MKYLIVILTIIFTTNANAYTLYTKKDGSNIQLMDKEVNIVVDSSVEEVAPPETIYPIIEEAYLQWLDYIEQDIIFNFIYDDCTENTTNCVKMGDTGDLFGKAAFAWDNNTNSIIDCDITISEDKDWQRYSITSVMLHEVGHCYGIDHSDYKDSAMHSYYNEVTELSGDDIAAIKTLYSENETAYIYIPLPEAIRDEEDEKDSSEKRKGPYVPCCSFFNSSSTKSIFSLIF